MNSSFHIFMAKKEVTVCNFTFFLSPDFRGLCFVFRVFAYFGCLALKRRHV